MIEGWLIAATYLFIVLINEFQSKILVPLIKAAKYDPRELRWSEDIDEFPQFAIRRET
jgi:hypothetical protein